MPRPPRIDFPGARHHVMNRGLRRGPVFIDDWCCEEFLSVLPEAVDRFGIIIHSYALMPNHFHLQVESVFGNLSKAMAYISSTYSRRVNDRFHWDGSVFRGRFHNRVVTSLKHWYYLLAYIHLNPVKARLILSVEQSRWTSHAAYAGELSCPDWLQTELLLSELGGQKAYRDYIRDIQMGRKAMPTEFDQVLFGRRRSSDAIITSQKEAGREITPEQAMDQVVSLTGASKETLKQTKRGKTGNPVRSVAAWWLTHGAGLSNIEAGAYLNMSPVAISKALTKVQSQVARDPVGNIAQWILELKELASKGQ